MIASFCEGFASELIGVLLWLRSLEFERFWPIDCWIDRFAGKVLFAEVWFVDFS